MKRKTLKIHKLYSAGERENKKEQGAFDGRFFSRVHDEKSTYSRKTKHKNREV